MVKASGGRSARKAAATTRKAALTTRKAVLTIRTAEARRATSGRAIDRGKYLEVRKALSTRGIRPRPQDKRAD